MNRLKFTLSRTPIHRGRLCGSILLIVCLFSIHSNVKAQCNPAILSSTHVLSINTPKNGGYGNTWLCAGVYDSTNSINDTFYVEPGAILYGMNGVGNQVYVPKGAMIVYNASAVNNTVYFVDSADVTLGAAYNATLIQCSSIVFNTTNAPPGCTTVTGVEQINPQLFQLYPNPSGRQLTIRHRPLNRGSTSTLKIYNVLGEIVLQSQITSSEAEIDVSGFSKGIYIVHLTDGVSSWSEKLVKD